MVTVDQIRKKTAEISERHLRVFDDPMVRSQLESYVYFALGVALAGANTDEGRKYAAYRAKAEGGVFDATSVPSTYLLLIDSVIAGSVMRLQEETSENAL